MTREVLLHQLHHSQLREKRRGERRRRPRACYQGCTDLYQGAIGHAFFEAGPSVFRETA